MPRGATPARMGMETERPCSREVSGQKMSVWDAAKGKIPFKRQSVAKYLQGSVKGSLPLKEKQKILLQDKSSPLSSPGPCLVRRPRAAGAPKGTLGTGQATELTLPGRCTPHCSVRRTKKNTTIIIKIEITSTRRGLAARPVPKGKAAVKGRHRLPGGAAPQPLTLSTSTVLQRGSSRRAGGAAASVGFSVLGQLCKKKEKPRGESRARGGDCK